MLNTMLSAFFAVALLGCIVANLFIRAKVVAQINCKRDPRLQLSYMDRDFLGMLDSHRQLYPKSTLRIAMILLLGLSVACALGLAVTQNSH